MVVSIENILESFINDSAPLKMYLEGLIDRSSNVDSNVTISLTREKRVHLTWSNLGYSIYNHILLIVS